MWNGKKKKKVLEREGKEMGSQNVLFAHLDPRMMARLKAEGTTVNQGQTI